MPTIVTEGDQLLFTGGEPFGLKKPSVPFNSFFGGQGVRLIGKSVMSYAMLYRRQPWVAIAVNKLNRQVSRLPLKVYELNSQGDRQRVREGTLVDALEKPWVRGSASSLKQAFAFPVLLHGNSVLAKVRNRPGQAPIGFLPMDWRFLRPIYNDPEPIQFWETSQFDENRYLAPEEVIHTSWMAPDGPVGVSPLEQLGVTIAQEDAAQRYSSASFENAVRPSGALVAPAEAKLDREERQELRDEISAAHGGADKAFKLMLLTGGLDWKPFSQTAKEAELISQKKLNREEVAAVYDIPPPMIGILDNATYSNISEQHDMLYQTVLGPWLDLIENTIQAQLIDPEPAWQGLFVEFDLGEVLKGDTVERINSLKTGIQTGLYTINEARKIENLQRIDHPWADRPLIPSNNMAPLGEAPTTAQAREQVPQSPNPPTGTGNEPDDSAPMLATHIKRAEQRVLSRLSAGVEDPLDKKRFVRELASDLGDPLDPKALPLAEAWGETLERGVKASEGSPERIKQFFKALRV